MRIFLFSFCFCFALAARGAEIKIDFNDFSAGSTPANFSGALAGGGEPGDWKIVMDEVPSAFARLTPQAPVVNRQAVLAQLSRDPADEHFPMFIYDGATFQNFKLTTRFKIVSGAVEQMAGVVFRFQNASNFYVIRASALGQNIRFYKVVNGIRSEPLGPKMEISTNVWHALSIQCQANQILFWLDEKLVMPPLNDNTFLFGRIGFWTKSDAVSYFGETTIDYTPRIPAAQALVQSILQKEPRILGLQIIAPDAKGSLRIIASKNEKEIGRPGNGDEKNTIENGKVYFGKSPGVIAVTLPFRDRNGDPMAAVHVRLKSFFGESQENAVTRATLVVQQMQAQITSSDQLLQ